MSDLNQIQNPSPFCYLKREQLKVNIRKEKLTTLLNSKRFKFQVPQAESTFPEVISSNEVIFLLFVFELNKLKPIFY